MKAIKLIGKLITICLVFIVFILACVVSSYQAIKQYVINFFVNSPYNRMNTPKIKLVVINNCMLGYILPTSPNSAGILASSVIRGAVCASQAIEPKAVHPSEYRLASAKDFDEFRVHFKGFDNESEYEFQK